MDTQRMLIIGGGTVAMLVVMLLRRKNYPEVALWKYPIISIFLALSGVAGAMLMFFIENGHIGGTSFFGAILFVPVFMLPMLLLRVPYGKLMALCAPAECIMLAILKVDCIMSGCCAGRVIGYVQYPSQLVEMLTILAIMLVLIVFEKKPANRDRVFPAYLILYGSTRFLLNGFRADLSPFVWILPPGHFWGVVSTLLGILWLACLVKKDKANTSQAISES